MDGYNHLSTIIVSQKCSKITYIINHIYNKSYNIISYNSINLTVGKAQSHKTSRNQ